jgi:hypothetical protein
MQNQQKGRTKGYDTASIWLLVLLLIAVGLSIAALVLAIQQYNKNKKDDTTTTPNVVQRTPGTAS